MTSFASPLKTPPAGRWHIALHQLPAGTPLPPATRWYMLHRHGYQPLPSNAIANLFGQMFRNTAANHPQPQRRRISKRYTAPRAPEANCVSTTYCTSQLYLGSPPKHLGSPSSSPMGANLYSTPPLTPLRAQPYPCLRTGGFVPRSPCTHRPACRARAASQEHTCPCPMSMPMATPAAIM